MPRYAKPESGNIASSNTRISSSSNAAFEVVLKHFMQKRSKPRKGDSKRLDEIDMQMLPLMLAGYSSTKIAQKMNKPLSTIQRRAAWLTQAGYVVPILHLNFKKFGLRRGLLQFKCTSANLKEAVQKISVIKGVESVGGYLGSLDVIANVVYSDSTEVLDIISNVQKLNLISDVTWSEEIHSMPV